MKKLIKKAILHFIDILGYKVSKKNNISTSPPLYWSALTHGEIRRLFHYEMFMKTISISGSIVECGVSKGGTISFIKNLQKEFDCSRKIWGFDSFEGFSQPNLKDGSSFSNNYDYFNQKYTNALDSVRQSISDLTSVNINNNEIFLIKGWIPDSFEHYDGSPVSLLNLDVDIYEPTKATLEFFWPLLKEDAIILLDEYDFGLDAEKWPGAKLAIDEFCNKKNISVSKHFTGRFYIKKT